MIGHEIFLNVPVEDEATVKSLGAKWDLEQKGWFLPSSESIGAFVRWLPAKYRPGVKPPYLVAELVPYPCWYINLRSLLPKHQWDFLRKDCYQKAGNRCQVCGARGQEWPVECNEQWKYIEETASGGIQKLLRLAALCPACHRVKHLGKANIEGKLDLALAQLCFINNWSQNQADEHANAAFQTWLRRNEMSWTFDLSILKRYGINTVTIQRHRFEPVPIIIGVEVVLC